MINSFRTPLLLLTAILLHGSSRQARGQSAGRESLAPSSITSARWGMSGHEVTFGAAARTMIKNRARSFASGATGRAVSASGTLYWALTDADVRNLPQSSQTNRLAPPSLDATEGVRKVQILVDLQRPITVTVPRDHAVNVGTTTFIGRSIRSLDVTARISARVTAHSK